MGLEDLLKRGGEGTEELGGRTDGEKAGLGGESGG